MLFSPTAGPTDQQRWRSHWDISFPQTCLPFPLYNLCRKAESAWLPACSPNSQGSSAAVLRDDWWVPLSVVLPHSPLPVHFPSTSPSCRMGNYLHPQWLLKKKKNSIGTHSSFLFVYCLWLFCAIQQFWVVVTETWGPTKSKIFILVLAEFVDLWCIVPIADSMSHWVLSSWLSVLWWSKTWTTLYFCLTVGRLHYFKLFLLL